MGVEVREETVKRLYLLIVCFDWRVNFPVGLGARVSFDLFGLYYWGCRNSREAT